MPRSARPSVSPQARGRELAREGARLWREQGSVKAAAAELMRQHQDVPSIQAYRYACRLSQDQAAARYNEVTAHQTSLGGTTINAWETWARGKGVGSAPTFSSLLVLADAYGRGPLGVAGENLSPGDVIGEVRGRLTPEAQVSLNALSALEARTARSGAPGHTVPSREVGTSNSIWLTDSSAELSTALLAVVRGAEEILVAVGPGRASPRICVRSSASFARDRA